LNTTETLLLVGGLGLVGVLVFKALKPPPPPPPDPLATVAKFLPAVLAAL